jgi:hypothetical protein
MHRFFVAFCVFAWCLLQTHLSTDALWQHAGRVQVPDTLAPRKRLAHALLCAGVLRRRQQRQLGRRRGDEEGVGARRGGIEAAAPTFGTAAAAAAAARPRRRLFDGRLFLYLGCAVEGQ